MINVIKIPAQTRRGDRVGYCYQCYIDDRLDSELVFFTHSGWQTCGKIISLKQANSMRPEIVTAILAEVLGSHE